MSKKIERRQSIIQAAIEVFGKNGFKNSSISEIAQRANVAEGTIYQYFKDKEDLFFSIPIEKTKEFCRELELHLQGITGTFNKIRKFIWYYLHFFKMNPEYGRILMLEMRVSRSFVKTDTYRFLRTSTSQILEIIREGQEEGVIRKDVDVYIMRQLILGILEHMVTRWLLKGEKYDLMGHFNEVSELVMSGINDSKRELESRRSWEKVRKMKDSKSKWIATDCTICYHSCGMEVLVEEGRITKIRGLKNHPLNKGRLCPKGARAIELVYHPDRLKYPLKKVNGQWKRIFWEDALTEVADKLQRLKKEFGPESLSIFSGSIGVENLEMMELAQRFKGAFGSPNFISIEGICYRMRIRARQMTFGKYPVEEMNTKLYVLWGHNPEQSDFPLNQAIQENLAKGSKLVVIDPKKISLAKKAEMYLPIRPGTDGALGLALMHVIIKENLYDRDFVERWTYGFDKLVDHIEPYTPQWAEKITWVPAKDIRKLARLYATAECASIFQGTNTQDQTANGTQNSRAFAILQTITGNINNPGGWVIGPRLSLTSLGIPTERTPIGANDYTLFYDFWGRKSPFGQVVCFPDSVPNVIKALIVTGGNPVVSMPDSNAFREALKKLELLVVHDLFMTETADLAHYVLPGCSHLEKNGLAYSYNVCHGLPYLMLRKKAIEPLYESRSEFMFWKELAKRMDMGEVFPWETDEEVVELELKPSGLKYKELKEEKVAGAYYMPKKYGMEGYEVKGFSTPSKKIEIYSETFEKAGFDPLPTYREPDQSPLNKELSDQYPLILTTGARILYYTHAQHRNIKGLKERSPEPFAEIHKKTAEKFGIQDGDSIFVESNRGQIKVKAHITEEIAEGVVSIPHGWSGEANVNLLTDIHCREPIMGYPQMKSQLCSIRKA